ncbi:hypothetical protein CRI77_04660 [Mycolicibacterium duvalii]|uniref:Uncharacterized protein n=1 Tax=Mycolicibacterium duvalii TaxID=39688 RepID=A0A7I7JZE4_9MYCO|nr:hypothetical protein [Mycolicibacterium duvalii]MCV7369761.1 hypothetical protein [Mycolicibacterium duvalii]PEG43640.1 hypothetical protein CRI77_04660 [Mycolicibacterium duvalii]BBX17246.1 hypothetical protein MDUV_21060 [Mycolicibacterium duvalii]
MTRGLGPVRRAWLEFVGPETTPVGTATTLTLAGLGGVAAVRRARARRLTASRTALLVVAAVDLWGGAWANNTAACARWYERPGQSDADHLRFAVVHVHPLVLAWVDGASRRGWVHSGLRYGYLLGATAVIRRLRAHRRPLGWVLTAAGIALDAALEPYPSARWFGPVFYLKLLAGHAAAARWPDDVLAGAPRDVG